MNYCRFCLCLKQYVLCSFVPLVNMSVCPAGDLKQMDNCLANELLMDSVLDSIIIFWSFVLLVYKSVRAAGDFKQMYKCLANELLMDSVLDSNFRIFGLLFLWFIRVYVRLVILNKCTIVWQMNYCPLLY